MELKVKRLVNNADTSISTFSINCDVQCFGIEDEPRTEKVSGETRVPAGTYKVALRAEGSYHEKYKAKFNELGSANFMGNNWHRGMLCVYNAPDWKIINAGMEFQYILIHTGNTDEDTMGCYLPNLATDMGTFTGSKSMDAYKKIYPIIRDAILNGEEVTITYIDED